MDYNVRSATIYDVDVIMRIYEEARAFMRLSGNSSQWTGGYPSEDLICDDISRHQMYICENEEGNAVGVFVLADGEDPTYREIDGCWSDHEPYVTIHRMGGVSGSRGVADTVLRFALSRHERVRADTHEDNIPMRRWLESRGFGYCGIIRVADGSPRLAYATKRHASVSEEP